MDKVNLEAELARFCGHWSPRIVAELNGQHAKLVKVSGELVWHQHADEGEFFLVLSGHLTIHRRDRAVELEPGEFLIVPRGVEHKPAAVAEGCILLLEPAGTLNTGDVRDRRTVHAPAACLEDCPRTQGTQGSGTSPILLRSGSGARRALVRRGPP